MARLAISKDYFPAYARLPRKAQRKADEFLTKFQRDSTAASIHLEPLHDTVDKQLRSARIGDDYRVILRAPDKGDIYLVLWADHHDEAYRWAATKQTAIHPATGSLQIFDATVAREVVEAPQADQAARRYEWKPEEPAATRPASDEARGGLFQGVTDHDLFLAGVPRPLLPSVRALLADGDLDNLLPHLPPESGEVLTALAAGVGLDEALEEVLGRTIPPAGALPPAPIDTADVTAALARDTTQRQFRLFEDTIELDSALKHPLDVWRVYLHPRQRRLAHARTKGPTRVLGGPGTGKTVVALHRAAFLVREVFKKPDDRILFTTFTVNLAHDLRTQLSKLLEPDQLARVEIINLDAWASNQLRKRGRPVRLASRHDQQEHLRNACQVYGLDHINEDFYLAELRDVILEQDIRTEEEYVRAVRRNRGVPLSRSERRLLWPVFAAYREGLEDSGLLDPIDILRRARAEVEAEAGSRPENEPLYRSVIVDEVQDFGAEGLRLVRAIAGPERPDDLFLVGDAHQRIYGRPVPLSACGIQVRGRRSQTLRLNYRTTGAICRWSLGLLGGVEVDDLDEGKADRRGYVSVREGPKPRVQSFVIREEEELAVVETVKQCLGSGIPPEHICVVARANGPLRDRFLPALERAGITAVHLEREEPRHPAVRLATMHRVKGLEFGVVILVGISKRDMPSPNSDVHSEDPLVARHALMQERALLYVAASRARDELHVFYTGAPSVFLEELLKAPEPASPRPVERATHVSETHSGPTQGRAEGPSDVQAPVIAAVVRHEGPSVQGATTGEQRRPEAPDDWDSLRVSLSEAQEATPLSVLDVPARVRAFAVQEKLTTLGELARRSFQQLMDISHVGPGAIKRLTLSAWEYLRTIEEPGPDGGPAEGEEPGSWDAVRRALNPEQSSVLLESMDLPTRIRSYCARENLVTLGDLAGHSTAMLMAAGNLGRATVRALPQDLQRHFRQQEEDVQLVSAGLLECFKQTATRLDTIPRLIITRRSGLGGEAQTLGAVGEILGVSRERIRQIEQQACRDLGRQGWATEVRRRVTASLADGAASLDELRTDPWWAAVCEQPDVLGFIVESVLDMPLHVIALEGQQFMANVNQDAVDGAWKELRKAARGLELPASLAAFAALGEQVAGQVGTRLGQELSTQLRGLMRTERAADGTEQVLALGDTREAEVLALLRSSPEPMRTEDLFALIGNRVGLPDEVIHFGRGRVGLKQHLPDFEQWQVRLVPAAVRIVQEQGPTRQWSCTELLDELREEQEIPDWLTAYGLAALIKHGEGLNYLGRLRVALPGATESDARLHVDDTILEILRAAGEPLPRDVIVGRLRERIAVTEFSLVGALQRPQFVRLDDDLFGLLERDVPGGSTGIAEAAEHAVAMLARRDRGMSLHHLHEELLALGPIYADWTEQLLHSVFRADSRFRFSRSGAVGLAAWESTRVPTRLELVRAAIQESDGRVSAEAVFARIEAHYGYRPSRNNLTSLVGLAGGSLDGDWIQRDIGMVSQNA